MGVLDFLFGPSMEQGVEEYHSTPGALLLDVRTPQEYREGHVPGSINLPLQEIEGAGRVIPDKETPVFLYCRSGARSGEATRFLEQMGYSKVKNIGGIISYHGKVER